METCNDSKRVELSWSKLEMDLPGDTNGEQLYKPIMLNNDRLERFFSTWLELGTNYWSYFTSNLFWTGWDMELPNIFALPTWIGTRWSEFQHWSWRLELVASRRGCQAVYLRGFMQIVASIVACVFEKCGCLIFLGLFTFIEHKRKQTEKGGETYVDMAMTEIWSNRSMGACTLCTQNI